MRERIADNWGVTGVVLMAFATVICYSVWGGLLLKNKQALAESTFTYQEVR